MKNQKVWTASLATVACVLLAVPGAAAMEAQAAFTPERSPAPGSRIYANARVVAIDAQARTITVRGGGVGRDETFPVEIQARPRVSALKIGEQVILTLRAGDSGGEVVTRVERATAGAGAPSRTVSGRATPRRRGSTAAPTRPAPSSAASPAVGPSPSPEPTRLPTDTVGPLRDPRLNPNFDPRQNPLRDPRVVPGLSEPVPAPTPTPTATPTPTPTPPPISGLMIQTSRTPPRRYSATLAATAAASSQGESTSMARSEAKSP